MNNQPNDVQGYCLHRLELLNWGTFDGQIWTLELNGRAALLTGANGSGKSTLVDALLTLLVPTRGRGYNQAAGGGGKRERTELSYVRGAYGKVQQEGEYRAKEQYLRDKNSYAVLVAIFSNGREWLTAAQFFYLHETLNRFYLLADTPLSIGEHFSQIEDIRALKKRLRGYAGVQIFEQFKPYSQQFCKRVNLRSDKALDLFNQTVTIKEIGSLNEFVRQHMLELPPIEEKIKGLVENYDSLTQAHEAIEKATKQVNVLRPLINLADKYEAQVLERERLEQVEAAVAPYFTGRKQLLLEAEIKKTEWDLAEHQRQLTTVETNLHELRGRATSLEVSISQDATGQRLKEIENDLRYWRREEERRRQHATAYNQLAMEFSLPEYGDEKQFFAARQRAEGFRQTIATHLAERQASLRDGQIEQSQLTEQQHGLTQEIESLSQRKSQIPAQNLRLRGRILDALTLAEEDVPFVGELVRVRENEQNVWEGAIERLLHNFGLSLLVPERHYRRFAEYVRQNHLNGRLVFHRIPETDSYRPPANLDPAAVYAKVRVKPQTPYKAWLEYELHRQFDHTCCVDMEAFGRASKAITAEGLLKSGQTRHEKDDRHVVNDRSRYILGWDNKEKLRAFQAELAHLNQKMAQVEQKIEQANAEVRSAYQKQERLESFLKFGDFTAVDWRTTAATVAQLVEEQTALHQSSDELQTLRQQLAQVKRQIEELGQKQQVLTGHIGRFEYQIQTFTAEMATCKAELKGVDEIAMKAYAAELTSRLTAVPTLATIDTMRRQIEAKLRDDLRQKNSSLQGTSNNLTGQMSTYKRLFPAESTELDNSLEAIPTFRQTLQQLEHDDLPQYEKRFKSLLNEKITENIVILRSDLYKLEEEIEESIAILNQSLRHIPYTADTYIQLQTKPNLDPEIRQFKLDLTACVPDMGQLQQDYEASYQRVRPLIDQLKNDERWKRKVTDVRHWRDFSAVENYRADDTPRDYYTDSSGKSGGQKAKLAYTILASAIAYQYGLDTAEPQPHTFRFVVVDEAFSRSDEANSRYAMELFQTMGLQLLVVTPLTGLQVAEPYVHSCHFVWNNSDGNNSQVKSMTIEELRHKRQEWERGPKLG